MEATKAPFQPQTTANTEYGNQSSESAGAGITSLNFDRVMSNFSKTCERAFLALSNANELNARATVLSGLKSLPNPATFSQLRDYFSDFEALTSGLSNNFRINILRAKLSGKPKFIFEHLLDRGVQDFAAIRREIFKDAEDGDASQAVAFSKLVNGVFRDENESLFDFGKKN